MKYVKEQTNLTVTLDKGILHDNGRYVSKKYLASVIRESSTAGEELRNKFYNGCKWNKYNLVTIGGVDFIDVKNPMKQKRASLILTIKIREEKNVK